MRVALNRKGDYSVRAVLYLARHYEEGRHKAREIAREMDIPSRYLPQILGELVHLGLLTATAGPEGGYRLARDPEDVTLLDVVEAAEGPIGLAECVLRGGPCDWAHVCPLHHHWNAAEQAFTRRLQRTTFADLAATDASIEQAAARSASDPPHEPAHVRPTTRRGTRAPGTR